MKLRPRQYLLIAVILVLGVFNLVRSRHARMQRTTAPPPAVSIAPTSPASPAAWAAFDKAAALRDASDAEFQPALKNLEAENAASPADDVFGCKTWLLFYRQGKLHPAVDPTWQTRSTRHLEVCTKEHRDATQ